MGWGQILTALVAGYTAVLMFGWFLFSVLGVANDRRL